tara:strand:- start:2 stop:328 length:327 start_codon:yes stop_codon:yes gene_type:complete
MAGKGRPKGQQSKSCLIKDDKIAPFEIHVDKYNYILINGKTGQTEGYYTKLTYCLRAILKMKYIPQGGDGQTYTIKEYIDAMQKLQDEMAELLVPAHHTIKYPKVSLS